MTKIYGVSRGSYSGYGIVALFSTKEKAQDFINTVKAESYSDYNDIEEYELDPDASDRIRRGYSVWRVMMLRDGATEEADRTNTTLYDVEDCPSFSIWRRSKAPAYQGRGMADALVAIVWAKSEEAAVKIVNEKRAQMIATGEWK